MLVRGFRSGHVRRLAVRRGIRGDGVNFHPAFTAPDLSRPSMAALVSAAAVSVV